MLSKHFGGGLPISAVVTSAEIAALRGVKLADAQEELERSGAQLTPAADDGYWSPP